MLASSMKELWKKNDLMMDGYLQALNAGCQPIPIFLYFPIFCFKFLYFKKPIFPIFCYFQLTLAQSAKGELL